MQVRLGAGPMVAEPRLSAFVAAVGVPPLWGRIAGVYVRACPLPRTLWDTTGREYTQCPFLCQESRKKFFVGRIADVTRAYLHVTLLRVQSSAMHICASDRCQRSMNCSERLALQPMLISSSDFRQSCMSLARRFRDGVRAGMRMQRGLQRRGGRCNWRVPTLCMSLFCCSRLVLASQSLATITLNRSCLFPARCSIAYRRETQL